MSSGVYHYREAERLLVDTAALLDEHARTPAFDALTLGIIAAGINSAQVHATLALVAATVGSCEQDFDLVDAAVQAWAAVLT